MCIRDSITQKIEQGLSRCRLKFIPEDLKVKSLIPVKSNSTLSRGLGDVYKRQEENDFAAEVASMQKAG